MRAIREARNMSLRTLQQKTGLNRGYLSRMERGLIRESDADPVQKVAQALNVSPDAITHEEMT
jgi:transcriptional regulator with XRE-family HTH domain